MEVNKALNRVMAKHQAKFDGFFQDDEQLDHEEDDDFNEDLQFQKDYCNLIRKLTNSVFD